MNNWLILFVKTGNEQYLLDSLRENLCDKKYLPFLPVREKSCRSKGIITKKEVVLFPSYLFVASNMEPEKIAGDLWANIANIEERKDIYRILHYGNNKNDVVMRKRERQRWQEILDENHKIIGSVGKIIGDKIKIISGALVGMESRIKKISRHKREAIVEMEMMGVICDVRVMLQVVEKE